MIKLLFERSLNSLPFEYFQSAPYNHFTNPINDLYQILPITIRIQDGFCYQMFNRFKTHIGNLKMIRFVTFTIYKTAFEATF